MYECKLTDVRESNKSLANSDCVLIPKNMSSSILSVDSIMYCFKITHSNKFAYCRFSGISPDEYVHVPQWILNDLNYENNQTVTLECANIDQGKLLEVRCSKEVSDPTKILEHGFRDHKIFYIGKKLTITMFDDFSIEFNVIGTDNNKPMRVLSEICYDITYPNDI